ncbi:MAG: S-adenosylmethionine:tRNA ribosyltransferase-isomerase, partial [Bacteroidota bacterium]|nr:S-adenosylmethionine:tRNA ribosyltransferase-isomerase [Bacteroidota bacterium]
MHPKEISIQEYDYPLPEGKIAFFPLKERDQSKLLVFQKGQIREDTYLNLAGYLPQGTLLVFNDTRVINARILFAKPTGAVIEIFCLEPEEAVGDYALALSRTHTARWKCMIGGAGKWKEHYLQRTIELDGKELTLKVELCGKLPDAYIAQ